MDRRVAIGVMLGAVAAACGGRGPPPRAAAVPPAGAPSPPRAEEGAVLAPPPFTAGAIRAATGEGQRYRWRVTTPRGVLLRDVRFVDVGPDGATIVVRVLGEDGEPVRAPTRAAVTWDELEEHGTFPADATEVEEVRVDVPAGSFDAWLYDVRIETEDGARRTRAWFAVGLPGAPVRNETWHDGQLVSTTELLEHEPGARP